MKVALLGHGKEGQAIENYLKSHHEGVEFDVFENLTPEEFRENDYSGYDYVFRSPSIPPLNLANESSVTRYFFDHCPCPIIGVTGTKGKGTTCSFIKSILEALSYDVYLVGNIGEPSINVLDQLTKDSVVVYEMSSFQLWDLKKSPQTAIVLRIEPDHLNVHKTFENYVEAKSHIAAYQSSDDNVVYFKNNSDSVKIAEKSLGHKFPYPIDSPSGSLEKLLGSLQVPGDHNKENAEAALIAVSAFLHEPLDEFLTTNYDKLEGALKGFKGLPHHLEFVRTVNGVDYYDDSFSASSPSLEVALKSFPDRPVVLIAGGKDRGLDLHPHKEAIFKSPNLVKAVLIGETKNALSENEPTDKFILKDDYKDAILTAKSISEEVAQNSDANPVVLLSPGAASFDMFKDFYDRGDQFKQIVGDLQ